MYALGTCDGNLNYCDFFSNCEYHESVSLSNVVKHNRNGLFIIYFNVRSLQNNSDKLTTILANFSETPDIIAISKTRITYGPLLVNVDIAGYDFIHCDSLTKARRVGFYNKQSLPYKQKSDINVELDFVETCGLKAKLTMGR